DYTSQLHGTVCNKEVEQLLLRDECYLYTLQLLQASHSGSGLLIRINHGVLPPKTVHTPILPQSELTLSYCLMLLRLYFLLKSVIDPVRSFSKRFHPYINALVIYRHTTTPLYKDKH